MADSRFERLYAEHAHRLLSFLVYRTGDRALAEDVVSATFERVLRTRVRFDPRRGSEKTWLYTIALNVLRDHERRSGAERRALEAANADPSPAAGSPIETLVLRDALRTLLLELSVEEREAVALRYGADLKFAEIAKLTGESTATVSGRIYRALEKLKAGLGEPA
jgi:RNA polymerase sigma factor (sigma-70 family)